jgi:predicted Zn-dependent protease
MDHHDWTQIDAPRLTERALDKCLRSRNPVAVEPGRYMAILEPQAVSGLLSYLVEIGLNRKVAESGGPFFRGKTRVRGGFFGEVGVSRLGERVIDDRLTIGADPMDPALGYAPFRYNLGVVDPSLRLEVFHAADWIKDGVLQHLAYDKAYGVSNLGLNQGLPSNGAFHMHANTPPVSIDEMIKTTKRGILVSRFSDVQIIDSRSALISGFTRDGVWLIENGAISKPVKNFRFLESPLFVLNQVEQIGAPERVFHPFAPVVCPALKVRDFSFTQLVDAV